jgi:WD40 repeat protein
VLGVGLIDGAIIIIDLILGVEKHFLEKHPSEVSSIAFWEDKVVMSGSIDGRVNIINLEEELNESKINKC